MIAPLEKRKLPPLGEPESSCNTNLFFGFFFDGTRNNYIKAHATRRTRTLHACTIAFQRKVYLECCPRRQIGNTTPQATTTFFASMYLDNERIGLALLQAINNGLYFLDLNRPTLLRHVPEAWRYAYAK